MASLSADTAAVLIASAIKARQKAYAPYSGFSVGAAVMTKEGEIFTGCNVENASYSATMCAERTAIFSAVAQGCREFAAIAVTGGRSGGDPEDFCFPCGMCLQVMSEFCSPSFEIYIVKSPDEVRRFRLRDLLPVKFEKDAQNASSSGTCLYPLSGNCSKYDSLAGSDGQEE